MGLLFIGIVMFIILMVWSLLVVVVAGFTLKCVIVYLSDDDENGVDYSFKWGNEWGGKQPHFNEPSNTQFSASIPSTGIEFGVGLRASDGQMGFGHVIGGVCIDP